MLSLILDGFFTPCGLCDLLKRAVRPGVDETRQGKQGPTCAADEQAVQ